jgi:hypothetical protein
MFIERGNRRISVIGMGLTTLVIISALAIMGPVHAMGVLTITGGAVGVILSMYFGADGFVKGKTQEPKP